MSFNLLLSFPDFNVTIYTSSTKVKEGATVTLNCTHDLPKGTISWLKDKDLQQEKNETIQIKLIQKTPAVFTCNVDSSCGNYTSTITIDVEGDCTAHHFWLIGINGHGLLLNDE